MGTHFRGTPAEARALDAEIKLLRATSALRSRLEARLRPAGLAVRQLGVLEALLHLGPLEQHELGAKLLVSRANVTLIVDELVRRGLVRRETSRDDRRCRIVHLTPAGRALVERVFPDHVSAIVEAFSALSAAEQRQLARLCQKLGLALAAPAEPPALNLPGTRRRST